jgi:hypothetical protein
MNETKRTGKDARACLSDRTLPLFPPYRQPEQRVLIRERLKRTPPAEDAYLKGKYLRYYQAAGGAKADFLKYWERGKHWEKRTAAQIRAGGFLDPGTAIMHMVYCTKGK